MSNTYFTSDLHFGHKRILTYENVPHRQYSNVDDMDEAIIASWNSTVEPSDTVYILGDFSFRKHSETLDILRKLKGKKVLVKGNHDNLNVECKEQLSEFHLYLERELFIEHPHYDIAQKIEIQMFHFPIMHWHKQYYGSWHLHGHLHGNPSGVQGRVLDVGWDAHGKLLSLEDIAEIMKDKQVRCNHHVSGEAE